MKKFKLIAILTFLTIAIQLSVNALQPINIEEQKAVNENAAVQLMEDVIGEYVEKAFNKNTT
jgi:hypothetical protein